MQSIRGIDPEGDLSILERLRTSARSIPSLAGRARRAMAPPGANTLDVQRTERPVSRDQAKKFIQFCYCGMM